MTHLTKNYDDIASPCVRNCCLDEKNICLGCCRSLAEILAWSGSTKEQKEVILEKCARRRLSAKLRNF